MGGGGRVDQGPEVRKQQTATPGGAEAARGAKGEGGEGGC